MGGKADIDQEYHLSFFCNRQMKAEIPVKQNVIPFIL